MLGIIDDRIELLARLETGNWETVYWGRDRSTGQLLRVRQLRDGFFDDPEAFEFFRNEYEFAIRLQHPVIPREYWLRRAEDGRVFLVAEYVPGTTLRVFLDLLAADEARCPADIALYIAGEISRGLNGAHELRDPRTGETAGVLHLDLCPSNILLSPRGTIHLEGLTISRAMLRRSLGDRPGRLPYLAPERIEGGYLDRRTDLFSLGAILFEMLTGLPPFPGATTAEVRSRIAEAAGDFDRLAQPGIPSALKPILKRALARSPAERHHDLGVFAADLDAVAESIKSVKPHKALAGLLPRVVEPEQLSPPDEEGTSDPEVIVTEIVVRSPEGDQVPRPEPVKVPADVPVVPRKKPDLEPIAALAQGDLLEQRPRKEPRAQRQRSSRFPVRQAAIGLGAVALILLILDFIVGITPLGKSIHQAKATRPSTTRELVSIPNGASIYINDRYSGRTPSEISQWADGVTTVRLELDGYAPVETTLVIEESRGPEFPVVVFQRRLSVRSIPPGAEVLIGDDMVSAVHAAGYMLPATDTATVGVRKTGLNPPAPLSISCNGPVGDYDTTRWIIEERTALAQTEITAIFSRDVTITSRPGGAAVYLDDDTTAIALAGEPLDLTLGAHRVTLRLSPYLDYSFEFEVTEESPQRYAPVFSRYVRITTIDSESGLDDIAADIRWVRRGERLIKSEDDELQTPYSLKLEAVDHEVMLAKKGYRDTVVVLPSDINVVTVRMVPEADDEPARQEPEEFRWVQFTVERSGKAVAGATVIGYEKDSGFQYEFGTTGDEGKILVKVPPGKFSFVAVKGEERSQVNDERIKLDDDTKSIKLKFR